MQFPEGEATLASLRHKHAEEIGAAYTAEGIIALAGSRLYTSMADTDDVIDTAVAGFTRAMENLAPVPLG